jgi:serine/threonine protein kinase
LGSGAFAVVHAGRDNRTGKDYAIKIASTENLTDKDLEALHIEMNVMAALQHPHLVKLHEIYKVGTDFYIVMEQMKGGELLDRIVQKEYYNEKEARDACLVLFEAMAYCHEKHIAHRDLKPENLLLTSTDDDSNIKIADFGFAKRCPEDGFRTMCGSPGYIAPEVLTSVNTGPYDWQCDMWSLGVIVYILLGGYAPFEEPNDEALLFEKIKCADYEFHEEYWGPVSTDAKNLISSLLTIDPRKRLTAKQALKHPWLTASDAILETQDLGVNLTELKKFNAKRKFRAAVGTVIATQRLTSLWQKQQ